MSRTTARLNPVPRGRALWRLFSQRATLRSRKIFVQSAEDGIPAVLLYGRSEDKPVFSVRLGRDEVTSILLFWRPVGNPVNPDTEALLIPMKASGEVLSEVVIPAGYASRYARAGNRDPLWWNIDALDTAVAAAGVSVVLQPRGAEEELSESLPGPRVVKSPLGRALAVYNVFIVAMAASLFLLIPRFEYLIPVLVLPVFIVVGLGALVAWVAYLTGWIETDSNSERVPQNGKNPRSQKLW